jgi:hypothetical protein
MVLGTAQSPRNQKSFPQLNNIPLGKGAKTETPQTRLLIIQSLMEAE